MGFGENGTLLTANQYHFSETFTLTIMWWRDTKICCSECLKHQSQCSQLSEKLCTIYLYSMIHLEGTQFIHNGKTKNKKHKPCFQVECLVQLSSWMGCPHLLAECLDSIPALLLLHIPTNVGLGGHQVMVQVVNHQPGGNLDQTAGSWLQSDGVLAVRFLGSETTSGNLAHFL